MREFLGLREFLGFEEVSLIEEVVLINGTQADSAVKNEIFCDIIGK